MYNRKLFDDFPMKRVFVKIFCLFSQCSLAFIRTTTLAKFCAQIFPSGRKLQNPISQVSRGVVNFSSNLMLTEPGHFPGVRPSQTFMPARVNEVECEFASKNMAGG